MEYFTKQKMRTSITNDQISPRLLFSHLYTCKNLNSKGEPLSYRTVYDYEIEYFLFSEGSMWINDRLYEIHTGDIVMRRPGDTTQAIMPFDCYGIFFDMTGRNHNIYDHYLSQQDILQEQHENFFIDALPTIFHPKDDNKYISLFDKIHKEFINGEAGSELIIKSLILQILFNIHSDIKNPLNTFEEEPFRNYDKVSLVIEYISRNLSNKIVLADIAEVAGFSPNHFHKIFTMIIGISPNEYIINLRLKHAKEMLARSRLAVTDIAIKCGFENAPYFSYVFSKKIGMSPRMFRTKYTLTF